MTQVFGILRCFTCFFFPCVFGVPGVERRSAWDPMLADKFGWQKLVLFNSFLWAFLSIYRRTEICVLCCSLKFQNILNELLNWRIGASCWDDAYAPFKFQRTLWMSSSIIQLLEVLGASRLRLATCAAANWKGIGTSNSQDMYSFSVSMKCRIHEFPSLVSIELNKHWLFSFLWSLDLLSWILHTVHSVWPSPSQVVWTLHWLLCDDQLAKNK